MHQGKKKQGVEICKSTLIEYHGAFTPSGQYQNGGTLKYPNQNTYQGDFVSFKPHGSGVKRYSNGNMFTGEFCEGKLKEGEMLFKETNEKYVGSWVDNEMEG